MINKRKDYKNACDYNELINCNKIDDPFYPVLINNTPTKKEVLDTYFYIPHSELINNPYQCE
jgi:hypothetical protein